MTSVPSPIAPAGGTPTTPLSEPPRETWRVLYEEARRRLANDVEARWLVEEASGFSWPELSREGPSVADAARARFTSMLERRAAGEPLQYVLGHWSFRTLDLMVDRRVLIPRPETEQVVEAGLVELDLTRASDPKRSLLAVDLGTGSGAIALSIAAERHRVEVWATDRSREALDVASANLAGLGGLGATRVRFAHGEWWSALPEELIGRVDLVISNPPYVSTAEMGLLDPVIRDWEPTTALASGPTGLEGIESILAGAAGWLSPRGSAVIEIAPHQSERAIESARGLGFEHAHIVQDLAGRDRALVARMSPT